MAAPFGGVPMVPAGVESLGRTGRLVWSHHASARHHRRTDRPGEVAARSMGLHQPDAGYPGDQGRSAVGPREPEPEGI